MTITLHRINIMVVAELLSKRKQPFRRKRMPKVKPEIPAEDNVVPIKRGRRPVECPQWRQKIDRADAARRESLLDFRPDEIKDIRD